MRNKVLLLQGPLNSVGINFFTEGIYRTPEERQKVWASFNAAENIRALSYVFRAYGYKIAYSAWSEDSDWIVKNSELFDVYCINSQHEIPSTVEFMGRPIQNNKEKLYCGIYEGLRKIQSVYGNECVVTRIRSDLAVDVREVEKSVTLAGEYERSFFVEFADKRNMFYVPDFITIANIIVTLNLYRNLISLCEKNESYHISSHIDHGIELLNLKEKGLLEHLICMHRGIHDSMVWRGLPRYYGHAHNKSSEELLFDCVVNLPPDITVEKLKQQMHPELSGKRKGNQ